jgi:hypothetical protein
VNCPDARLQLALGTSPDAPGLARHLLDCPRCREVAEIDRRTDALRRSLLVEPPPAVHVRARVLAEIARLDPVERDEVRAFQLGLAAAAAVLALVALAALGWDARPGWQATAQGLEGLLAALARVASTLVSVALAGTGAALRLLSLARDGVRPLAELVARLEPVIVTGIGLSYAAMLAAIVRVLERDLRRAVRPRSEESRP